MNIYQTLLVDHQKQRDLLSRLLETSGDTAERRKLYALLTDEAVAHANAEEQTLYAALIEKESTQPESRHSVAEHQTIDKLIRELDTIDMSSAAWLSTFKRLKHAIEHHLDEEEAQAFDLAQSVINKSDAADMAIAFSERKQLEMERRHARRSNPEGRTAAIDKEHADSYAMA